MPQYVFAKVSDPSVTQDLVYSMKEVPSVGTVISIEGVKWKRVFTRPQASFDTRVDPHSAKDYVKATSRAGSVGDLWDRSQELSQKRAQKEGGVDPVKQTYLKDYSRRHKGAKHPVQRRMEAEQSAKKAGIRVDWGDE